MPGQVQVAGQRIAIPAKDGYPLAGHRFEPAGGPLVTGWITQSMAG